MIRLRNLLLSAMFVAAMATIASADPVNYIGLNLDSNADWANQWQTNELPFRGWGQAGAPWDPGKGVTTDPSGQILESDGGSVTYAVNYPSGNYVATFTSPQPVTTTWSGNFGSAISTTRVGNVTTIVVPFNHPGNDPKQGVGWFGLYGASASNPVSNFHIAPAGQDPNAFITDFSKRTLPLAGYRTMPWQGGNVPSQDKLVTFTPEMIPQGNGSLGQPTYDKMIQLANQQQAKNLWINVPEKSTDAAIKAIADKFAANLNPNTKLHVEFGNEMWNYQFWETGDNDVAARTDGRLINTDPFGRTSNRYGLLAYNTANIFKTEFGSKSGQVKGVMGGQFWSSYFSDMALKQVKSTYGQANLNRVFDEVAVAPYVNDDATGSADQLLNQALARIQPGGDWMQHITDSANAAKAYGLVLTAYEGGDGNLTKNPASIADAASADPRMYTIYRNLIENWAKANTTRNPDGSVPILNLFSFRGQEWGALPDPLQHGSQKWDAILSEILPTGNATLTGTVNYNDFLILKQNWGKTGMWYEDGDFNHDGSVTMADFLLMKPNLTGLTGAQAADVSAFTGQSVIVGAGPPIPEPTGLAFIALGIATLARRPRKRIA